MRLAAESIQHILLTRFNVRAFGSRPTPGLDWLLHRTTLFEEVCFPSVASQSEQNFLWIVFVDVETPISVLRRLGKLQERRAFEICFVSHFDEHTVPKQIGRFKTDAPYLLTSRLDNDDAIANDYFSKLREHLKPTARKWINFDQGLQVNSSGLYQYRRTSNAFISLLEHSEKARSVMCVKHSHSRSVAPIEHVKGGAWWLQVVHETNLMNYVNNKSVRLSWTDAAGLVDGFCDEVVRYVKGQYASS